MQAIRKRPRPEYDQKRTTEKNQIRNAVRKEDTKVIDGIIDRYTHKQSFIPTSDALIYSCRYGKIELLHYFADKIDPAHYLSNMTKMAATHGHLPVLKWIKTWMEKKSESFKALGNRILPQYKMYYYEVGIGNAALKNDHLHILDWIYEETMSENIRTFIADDFILAKSQQTFQWLTDHGFDIKECNSNNIKKIIQKSLKSNKLGVLWWLRRNKVELGAHGNTHCFLYDQLLTDLFGFVGSDLFGLICRYV